MKTILLTAAALAAFTAAPAQAQNGPEVEIRNAVARVAVIVEDRSDVAVEIEQGGSGLPQLRVERRGSDILIDGGLGRRTAGIRTGDRIQNCRSGQADAKPGEGASVQVRDLGWINVQDAPLIVVRAPRDVSIAAGSAIYGSIGRGARSIELGNGGCGRWDVANTDGPVSLSMGGSGGIRMGTSRTLDISIGGSGSVSAGATGELEVAVGGSGDVVVARADGPIDISIGGSGDIEVRDGDAPELSVSIGGSGDVAFGGVAGDVDIAIAGSGDVVVARATGAVSRAVMGRGDIRIGT